MQGETGEHWRKLCEEAAVEHDPERLLLLAQEITRLLDEKEQRLKNTHHGGSTKRCSSPGIPLSDRLPSDRMV